MLKTLPIESPFQFLRINMVHYEGIKTPGVRRAKLQLKKRERGANKREKH